MITEINYITSDSWWDTDKTILPHLCSHFKLNVFSFDGARGPLKFEKKDDYGFASFFYNRQKYRDRDIRELFESWHWLRKILVYSKKDNSVNFIIPYKNPYLSLLYVLFLPVHNTIICSHNYIEHTDNRRCLATFIKRLLFWKFKFFHFYSTYQQDLFQNDYPNKKSFVTIMPLKDFGKGMSCRYSAQTTFLFFGNIRNYKRLDLFIEAANKVDAFFVIAGNCNKREWETYENLIQDKSKFKIDIRFIDDNEVANYFSSVDFLVLPYEDMTQSGPSLIALNYNLPIIASDVGSFKTMINDGVNGFLFKKGNVNSLIDVLNKAASLDKNVYKIMRTAQEAYKNNYSEDCNPVNAMDLFLESHFD